MLLGPASASPLFAVLAFHASVRVRSGVAFAVVAVSGGDQEERCRQGAEADEGEDEGEMG